MVKLLSIGQMAGGALAKYLSQRGNDLFTLGKEIYQLGACEVFAEKFTSLAGKSKLFAEKINRTKSADAA